MTTEDWTITHEPEGRVRPVRRQGDYIDMAHTCERDGCTRIATYFSARSTFGRPTLLLCGRHFGGMKQTWRRHGLTWRLRDTADPVVKRLRKDSAAHDRRLNDELNRNIRRRLLGG